MKILVQLGDVFFRFSRGHATLVEKHVPKMRGVTLIYLALEGQM